jgi:hypothetical protein
MNNLLLVVLAILIPFVFKILQVLKEQKQQLEEMNKRYEQSKQEFNNKKRTDVLKIISLSDRNWLLGTNAFSFFLSH